MCGGGSSTALSSAFDAPSVSRSASSISTIWKRPVAGRRAASWTTARISLTEMVRPSGVTVRTSAWVAASTVRQCEHWPHPPYSHCRAAAKALAATDRPEPGGPVNSQACVIAAAGTPSAPRDAATASGQLADRELLTDDVVEDRGEKALIRARRADRFDGRHDRLPGWPGRTRPASRSGPHWPAAADCVTTDVITRSARAATSRSVAGVNCQMCCSGFNVHHLRPSSRAGRDEKSGTDSAKKPSGASRRRTSRRNDNGSGTCSRVSQKQTTSAGSSGASASWPQKTSTPCSVLARSAAVVDSSTPRTVKPAAPAAARKWP